jgi:hypothetical protein
MASHTAHGGCGDAGARTSRSAPRSALRVKSAMNKSSIVPK